MLLHCVQAVTALVNYSCFKSDALNQICHKCKTKSLLSPSRLSAANKQAEAMESIHGFGLILL